MNTLEASSPSTNRAAQLTAIVMDADVANALWAAVDSGQIAELVPEIPLLAMEQDPIHRHKDVLAHTIAVVAKTPADESVRLAALFHDIAKPATRRFDHGGVTFRHHEAVGARMTRHRLTELGYPQQFVDQVSELVRLSGRFKGYSDGWSDAAVRRYAREAGPLLGRLNNLVRADCTTRNRQKLAELHRLIDELEARIADLAVQDRKAAERPQLDGKAVMQHLGVGPGHHVGAALKWLLELKRTEGLLDEAEVLSRLDQWWRQYQNQTNRK
ncbi:MAG: HDIG domain-containing protein [Acidimicrobiia bacterium]|nr:HDIG domain-containing protein [Acidimicrobiia bacterium]MCY4458658.1 HDIG domain-containing protein [Acidimicrobiaceae bacterium]